MNDTKDTTIPVLEHGDKMDAHAVDGQGSSTPNGRCSAAAPIQSVVPKLHFLRSLMSPEFHNKVSGLQFEHRTRNGVDAC